MGGSGWSRAAEVDVNVDDRLRRHAGGRKDGDEWLHIHFDKCAAGLRKVWRRYRRRQGRRDGGAGEGRRREEVQKLKERITAQRSKPATRAARDTHHTERRKVKIHAPGGSRCARGRVTHRAHLFPPSADTPKRSTAAGGGSRRRLTGSGWRDIAA